MLTAGVGGAWAEDVAGDTKVNVTGGVSGSAPAYTASLEYNIAGTTLQLAGEVLVYGESDWDGNADGKTVIWSVTSGTSATVNSSGLVTGVSNGTTEISAVSTGEGTNTPSIVAVTVSGFPEPAIVISGGATQTRVAGSGIGSLSATVSNMPAGVKYRWKKPGSTAQNPGTDPNATGTTASTLTYALPTSGLTIGTHYFYLAVFNSDSSALVEKSSVITVHVVIPVTIKGVNLNGNSSSWVPGSWSLEEREGGAGKSYDDGEKVGADLRFPKVGPGRYYVLYNEEKTGDTINVAATLTAATNIGSSRNYYSVRFGASAGNSYLDNGTIEADYSVNGATLSGIDSGAVVLGGGRLDITATPDAVIDVFADKKYGYTWNVTMGASNPAANVVVRDSVTDEDSEKYSITNVNGAVNAVITSVPLVEVALDGLTVDDARALASIAGGSFFSLVPVPVPAPAVTAGRVWISEGFSSTGGTGGTAVRKFVAEEGLYEVHYNGKRTGARIEVAVETGAIAAAPIGQLDLDNAAFITVPIAAGKIGATTNTAAIVGTYDANETPGANPEIDTIFNIGNGDLVVAGGQLTLTAAPPAGSAYNNASAFNYIWVTGASAASDTVNQGYVLQSGAAAKYATVVGITGDGGAGAVSPANVFDYGTLDAKPDVALTSIITPLYSFAFEVRENGVKDLGFLGTGTNTISLMPRTAAAGTTAKPKGEEVGDTVYHNRVEDGIVTFGYLPLGNYNVYIGDPATAKNDASPAAGQMLWSMSQISVAADVRTGTLLYRTVEWEFDEDYVSAGGDLLFQVKYDGISDIPALTSASTPSPGRILLAPNNPNAKLELAVVDGATDDVVDHFIKWDVTGVTLTVGSDVTATNRDTLLLTAAKLNNQAGAIKIKCTPTSLESLVKAQKANIWNLIRGGNSAAAQIVEVSAGVYDTLYYVESSLSLNALTRTALESLLSGAGVAANTFGPSPYGWTSTPPSGPILTAASGSNPAGTVTRPDFDPEDDKSVDLTLSVSLPVVVSSSPVSLGFKVKVLEKTPTDSQAVAAVDRVLNFGVIGASGDAETAVTSNLSLPKTVAELRALLGASANLPTGVTGVGITWASNKAAVVNASTGAVTRPAYSEDAEDAVVTVTATIKQNNASVTKQFHLTVKAYQDAGEQLLSNVTKALTWTRIRGANTGATSASVTRNLLLPKNGLFAAPANADLAILDEYESIAITWALDNPAAVIGFIDYEESEDEGAITDTVVITRPAPRAAAKTVTLTATISGNESSPIDFVLTVPAKDTIRRSDISFSSSTVTYDGTEKSGSKVTIGTNASRYASGGVFDTTYRYRTAGAAIWSDDVPVNAGSYEVEGTLENLDFKYSPTATLKINPKALVNANLTLLTVGQTFSYDGTAQEPDYEVLDGTFELELGKDFAGAFGTGASATVYSDNVDAGTATVRILGQGNYSGASLQTFTIAKAALSLDPDGSPAVTKVYDGTTAVPAGLTVAFIDKDLNPVAGLVYGDDYTITGGAFNSANVAAAATVTGTVTLVANGPVAKNYTLTNGAFSAAGTITKKQPANADLLIGGAAFAGALPERIYTGAAQDIGKATLKGDTTVLTVVYTIAGDTVKPIAAGTYDVSVTAAGLANYEDRTWTVGEYRIVDAAEFVAAAKAKVEGAEYGPAAAAEAGTDAAAKTFVEGVIAGLGLADVTTEVVTASFTAAVADTNGVYTFTVAVTGGGVTDTTDTLTLAITAPVSVASNEREVTVIKEQAVVAPISVVAGEFTAGPNPVAKVSGKVTFFWQGKALSSGTLYVYDVSGNLVTKVAVSDRGVNSARREIGIWNLADAKGRPAAEGTYLVKGALVGKDGGKVKVSSILGVSK